MSIGKSRRDLKLTKISQILELEPDITNIELSRRVGVHRNTVARYVGSVNQRDIEKTFQLNKRLVNYLGSRTQASIDILGHIFKEAYYPLCHSNPIQLQKIVLSRLDLEKEKTRLNMIFQVLDS